MSKRPDNLETLTLTLHMLRRIPRQRQNKITAKAMHEQLQSAGIQRDLRTVQRQLDMLSQHFEIERDDRSKPYGYCWKEQAKALAVPDLTPAESLMLQLAGDYLRHLLPTQLMQSLEPFFTQASKNLCDAEDRPKAQSAQLARQGPGKVRMVATSQPLLPPHIQPGVFEAVSQALYANQWLEVDYSNANGSRSQRKVMPLGLAQQGPRLYLVCRFEGFDNERSLALHRMHSATASTLSFERPPEFNLQQYDADGRFGFGNGKRIQLRFDISRTAGGHLTETPLAKDQQAQAYLGADGSERLRISATVVDSAMLDWWLRGFGDAVGAVEKIPLGDGGVGLKSDLQNQP